MAEQGQVAGKKRVPFWAKGLILLLAIVSVTSGVIAIATLKQVSDLRADLRAEIAARELDVAEAAAALMNLVFTSGIGPDDVQRWVDTGSVRLPAVTADDLRPPIGCFSGDYAVWTLFGLRC